MPRTIPEEVKERVCARAEECPDQIGVVLGAIIFRSNIPVEAVAEILHTTRASVYRWAYGTTEPRENFKTNIRKLIGILKRAYKAFDLPLKGTHAERMEKIVGVVVKHKRKPN